MIPPEDIVRIAEKREDKNLRFRTWLKNHADPDDLDERFKVLHEELFPGYDCCECGNCCRMYRTTVEDEEIGTIAAFLSMPVEKFKNDFLVETDRGRAFPAPCPMLQEDGKCRIYEVRPEECRGFPYTDKPERLWSLYGMMEYAGMCPVTYEIVERLKQSYGFR